MKTTLTTLSVSEQVIVFADIRGYHRRICSKRDPEDIFGFLSEYYSVVQRALEDSEGQIIKFIGDSILILFPASNLEVTIHTLKELKAKIDHFLSQVGFDSCFCIKAHLGTVAIGMMGERGLERLDICGFAVNQTALLPNEEWILSAELENRLKP